METTYMPNVHNGSTRIYWRADGDANLPGLVLGNSLGTEFFTLGPDPGCLDERVFSLSGLTCGAMVAQMHLPQTTPLTN